MTKNIKQVFVLISQRINKGNGLRAREVLQIVDRLVPLIWNTSGSYWKYLRRQYQSITGCSRKTAQVHFALAMAAAKKNLNIQSELNKTKVASTRQLASRYKTNGDLK